MTEHPFHTLLSLVNLDQKIDVLQEQGLALKQDLLNGHDQEVAIAQELERSKPMLIKARMDVDTCELEVKEQIEQEKQKRARLNELSKHKEIQSLNLELEHLYQAQQATEERLLRAWASLDNAHKQYEMQQKLYQERLAELHALTATKKEQLVQLQQAADTLIAQRPEQARSVPQEWLEKYTMLRSRVTDPIVPLLGNSCGACHFQLTSQELIRLQRGALLQCKQCFRLLFMKDVMDRKDNQESSGS